MALRMGDRRRLRRRTTAFVGPAVVVTGALALVIVAVLGAAHLMGTDPAPDTGTDDGTRPLPDRLLVACQTPERTADLVAAAVALDLAEAGTAPGRLLTPQGERTVQQWRHEEPQDFRRTCLALLDASAGGGGADPVNRTPEVGTTAGSSRSGSSGSSASSGSSGPWSGVLAQFLTALISVLSGALVTAVATVWRRPLGLGAQLRERGRRLEEQARAYLAQPTDDRFGALRDSRRDLAEVLLQVREVRPGWPMPESFERLTTARGPLGDGLHEYRLNKNLDKTDADREKARSELDLVRREVDVWASALSRPYRPHPALRRRPDSGEDTDAQPPT